MSQIKFFNREYQNKMTGKTFCMLLSLLVLPNAVYGQEIVVESVFLSTIHSAKVSAKETGLLEKIEVVEGEQVTVGFSLARLEQREAELVLQLTKQELKIAELEQENKIDAELARKSAKVAEAELKRSQDANRKFPESVSRTEIDRLALLVEKSALAVKQAEHEQQIRKLSTALKRIQFELSEEKLKRLTIRSPVAGTVVEINHKAGEWIQTGEVLMTILDTTRLRAEAVLPGKYRILQLKGRKVHILIPSQNTKPEYRKGTISFINPKINPVDGSFRIWAEIDNRAGKLRPGDSVKMIILSPQVDKLTTGTPE